MDHANNVALDAIDFIPETLLGAVVHGAGGERIGTVSHVHGLGSASQVIVDVGGFLGIGAKPVLMSLDHLTFLRNDDGTVHARTAWTKDDIRALPEHRH